MLHRQQELYRQQFNGLLFGSLICLPPRFLIIGQVPYIYLRTRCLTAIFLFRCFQLVMCGIIHFALRTSLTITHGCIQYQSLQYTFQCIAQHFNCESINIEISDTIGFLRQFSGIFGLLITDVGFSKYRI